MKDHSLAIFTLMKTTTHRWLIAIACIASLCLEVEARADQAVEAGLDIDGLLEIAQLADDGCSVQRDIDLVVKSYETPELHAEIDRHLDRSDRPITYVPQLRSQYLGIGGVMLRDTYLSPLNYAGVGISYMAEMSRHLYRYVGSESFAKKYLMGQAEREAHPRWLTNRYLAIDLAKTLNPAQNANIIRLNARYERSWLYRVYHGALGRVDVGGGMTLGVGGLYSTRNGNNPATVKLDAALALSLGYSYRLPWERFPALIRLTSRTDLIGTQFSQQYGESYYELYYVSEAIVRRLHLAHLGNSIGQQLRLTIDLPIAEWLTLSAGYRMQYRTSSVARLDHRQTDHIAFLGITRYILPQGRGSIATTPSVLPF